MDKKIFGSEGILGFDYGTHPYSSTLEEITVQHLLEQTDGFPASLPNSCLQENLKDKNEDYNTKTFIDCVLDDTKENPIDTPGAKWHFSNFGYVLLGRVIEKLTNKTYQTYVKKNILDKCGVTNMHIGKLMFTRVISRDYCCLQILGYQKIGNCPRP